MVSKATLVGSLKPVRKIFDPFAPKATSNARLKTQQSMMTQKTLNRSSLSNPFHKEPAKKKGAKVADPNATSDE